MKEVKKKGSKGTGRVVALVDRSPARLLSLFADYPGVVSAIGLAFHSRLTFTG
jgi:hypothetical protein